MTDYVNNGTGKEVRDQINTEFRKVLTEIGNAPVGKVGTKDVDETNIADGKIMKYDSNSDKLVYEDLPAGGTIFTVQRVTHAVAGTDQIPQMWDYNYPQGLVFCSSHKDWVWGSTYPPLAFDKYNGSSSQSWITADGIPNSNGVINEYIGYISTGNMNVGAYQITTEYNSTHLRFAPIEFYLEGSNDTTNGTDGTWTILDHRVLTDSGDGQYGYTYVQGCDGGNPTCQTPVFSCSNPGTYKAVRLRCTRGSMGAGVLVAELLVTSATTTDTYPSNPVNGQVVQDVTGTSVFKVYNNGAWH